MKNIKLTLWLILQLTYSVNAQNISDSTLIKSKKERLTTKSDKKTQILKITPLAFLAGYTSVAYEKSLTPKRSFELKLTLIGAGITMPDLPKSKGAAATIGYKFIKQPTEPPKKNRYQHILRGRYFRPDFTVAYYIYPYLHDFYEPNNIYPTTQQERLPIFYASLVPTIGYQKVWRKGFVTDIFMGAGLAAVTPMNGDHIIDTTNYSQVIILDRLSDKKWGIAPAFKTGLLIGGLF